MESEILLLLFGSALAAVLPNAAVALYDWIRCINKGK